MSKADNKGNKNSELEDLKSKYAELQAEAKAEIAEKEQLQEENKALKESDTQHKATIKELMDKVKAQEEKEAVAKPEFTVKGQKYRLNATALVINKERKEAKEILKDKKLQDFLVEKESGAISKVK